MDMKKRIPLQRNPQIVGLSKRIDANNDCLTQTLQIYGFQAH